MASKVEARALKLSSGANGTPFASVVYVTGRFTAFLITVRDAIAVPKVDWEKEAENKLGWNLSTTRTRSLPTTMSKRSPPPYGRRGSHYDSLGEGRTRGYDRERRQRDARDDHYDRRDRPQKSDRPQDRSRDNQYSHPGDRRYDSGYRNKDERRRDSGWGSRAQESNSKNQPIKRERSASRSRSRSPPRKRKRSASRDPPNGKELIKRSNRYGDNRDDERRVRKRERSEDARSDRRRARSASRCGYIVYCLSDRTLTDQQVKVCLRLLLTHPKF
jgi:hypothetical protein